jgi:hypothetical protein
MTIQGPKTSYFPLIDFASRAVAGGTDGKSIGGALSYVSAAQKAKEIRAHLESVPVFVRGLEAPHEDYGVEPNDPGVPGAPKSENGDGQIIGFTTEGHDGEMLVKGKALYERGLIYRKRVQ